MLLERWPAAQHFCCALRSSVHIWEQTADCISFAAVQDLASYPAKAYRCQTPGAAQKPRWVWFALVNYCWAGFAGRARTPAQHARLGSISRVHSEGLQSSLMIRCSRYLDRYHHYNTTAAERADPLEVWFQKWPLKTFRLLPARTTSSACWGNQHLNYPRTGGYSRFYEAVQGLPRLI